MWEVPRYRVQAYLKGVRQNRADQQAKAAQLRIARAPAEIQVSNGVGGETKIIPARVVLNDLRPTSITVFTSEGIDLDQEVRITLQQPKLFFVSGFVSYCRSFELAQRVLSTDHRYSFRVKIEFLFRNRQEREAVREFLASQQSKAA